MRNVVILDPKGVISKGGKQTLNRHIEYSNLLAKATGDECRLLVITCTKEKTEELFFKNLVVFNHALKRKSNLSFLRLALTTLRNKKVQVLVVGDPWSPFYLALVMKFLMNWRLPIQVQIHADLFSREWLEGGPMNRAKSILALPAIFFSNSLRFVSERQLMNATRRFKFAESKSFVSPVFLQDYSAVPARVKNPTSDSITLGVLGRIHEDRGLARLVSLMAPVIESNPRVRVFIAGEGEYRAELEEQVNSAGVTQNFRFLGQIDELEMPRFWEQIDVLISLAPSESFGRSIREALLAGIPVWAVESSGVVELKEIAQKGEIQLIDFSLSPLAQLSTIEQIRLVTVGDELTERIKFQNEQGLQKLISSWVVEETSNFDGSH